MATQTLLKLLVNLIDVTLTCVDANSKLVEVVTVAHVDDEKRVDNSLVQIWRVKLVTKLGFCSDFEHKVSRFGQDFEVDVQARFRSSLFCCRCLVVVMKFNLD